MMMMKIAIGSFCWTAPDETRPFFNVSFLFFFMNNFWAAPALPALDCLGTVSRNWRQTRAFGTKPGCSQCFILSILACSLLTWPSWSTLLLSHWLSPSFCPGSEYVYRIRPCFSFEQTQKSDQALYMDFSSKQHWAQINILLFYSLIVRLFMFAHLFTCLFFCFYFLFLSIEINRIIESFAP